ncbi:glycosyltransferase family 2 protein [Rhizosphaericola mali]|uniref:Glycosyltransferase family 2 protein n=1 Tax=Rhizosphaericola mali TaxID=2545455 RepID=A0A5P2G4H6_9BACT|nr:glycosyltransferase family 2 protein [Rhizosphaericola mali]QES87993.1 glycosyltransferase family 2 protein [Rhizosphaericola mali]
MLDISTIILTYNEELHIERCVRNALKFSKNVFIVDSFSTDNTKQIAEHLGAKVIQNKWENNHARQFNYGLKNLPIDTKWVFRLDADEYLSDALIAEMHEKLPKLSIDVTGVVMERKMIFLGRQINKGNVKWNMLRLFQFNKGECEDRWMDEHIVLKEGRSILFDNCFYDDNQNSLGWWIQKHDNYSIREAIELLNVDIDILPEASSNISGAMSEDAAEKRKKKEKYNRMPLFWRSFYYFIYRYFFKLGFIEGKEGFLWHFFQGWWYRTLVDAKIFEIKKNCGTDKTKIIDYLNKKYHIYI